MSTRWYWSKIGIQALVIFVVGLGLMTAFRTTKRQVVQAVETNSDLTIPLPFLPFNVDGQRAGNLRKITLHRSAPEHVESVEVTVRLTDASALGALTGCSVTVDDPTRLNERSSFRCVSDEAGMEPFGSVRIQTKGESGSWHQSASVPLLLPSGLTRQIQGRDAERHASDLERDRFRQLGDSIGDLARRFASASDAGVRDDLKNRMEALEEEMADLRESISEAARDMVVEVAPVAGSATVVAPGVKIEVSGAAPPVPGKVKVVVAPPKPPR